MFGSSCKFIDYFVYSEEYYPFFINNGFLLYSKDYSYVEVRKNLLHYMYTKIVHVKSFITTEVNRLKQEYHWNDYYWIGIQIRSGHIARDDAFAFFLKKDDYSVFISKAKDLMIEYENSDIPKKKPVRWFLATDSKNHKKEISHTYKKFVVTNNCKMVHSMVEIHKDDLTEGMTCTLLDAYLLASCDAAVTTSKSTYGHWAMYQNLNIKRVSVRKGEFVSYQRNQKK